MGKFLVVIISRGNLFISSVVILTIQFITLDIQEEILSKGLKHLCQETRIGEECGSGKCLGN